MGVVVLGMHRSGTSAVTRVIDLLGAPVGRSQLPPRPDNPSGFWEIAPLMELNDEILEHLGGSWDAPPLADPGAERDPGVVEWIARAREVFRAEHDGDHWVWKDPRACVLLPFWRAALGPGHVAVVVLRDPEEIARSLVRRNAMASDLALAIWERSFRGILRDAPGMPALVVRYDELVDAPAATVEQLADFLRDQRAAEVPDDRSSALGSLRPALRTARGDDAAISSMSAQQERLAGLVDGLSGRHDELPSLELPDETATTALLVSARRHGNLVRGRRAESEPGPSGGLTSAGLPGFQLALDHALVRQGESEQRLLEIESAGDARALGRLEQAALKATDRVRGVQRWLRTR